jgi:hypothetical protein
MRQQTKLNSFFLLFILSVSLFYGCIALSSTASATTSLPEKETTITGDWLSVQPDMSAINNNYKFYKDQGLLTAFNRGSEDHGNGIITFRYEALFDLKTLFYSTFDVKDFYPNLKEETLKYEILRYWYEDCLNINHAPAIYYQTFNSYDFGQLVPHEFNGDIPLKIDLNPDFYNPSGETIGDVIIGETDYKYKVKQIEVTNTGFGRVDKYKDKYEGAESDSLQVDLQPSDDIPDKFVDEVEESNAGAFRRQEITTTAQKGIADPVRHIGASTDNLEWGSYTYNMRVNLEPKVTRTKQDVEKKRLRLEQACRVWGPNKWNRWTDVENSPSKTCPYIQKSAHVYNYYVKSDYTVKVVFVTDMEIENYQEDPATLQNPDFLSGDWYWNADAGGFTNYSMPTESPSPDDIFAPIADFFGDLGNMIGSGIGNLFGGFFGGLFSGTGGFILLVIIVIALIIGIYLFIKIGVPIIRRYLGTGKRRRK